MTFHSKRKALAGKQKLSMMQIKHSKFLAKWSVKSGGEWVITFPTVASNSVIFKINLGHLGK